jgi:hypothetical protein
MTIVGCDFHPSWQNRSASPFPLTSLHSRLSVGLAIHQRKNRLGPPLRYAGRASLRSGGHKTTPRTPSFSAVGARSRVLTLSGLSSIAPRRRTRPHAQRIDGPRRPPPNTDNYFNDYCLTTIRGT